MRLLSSYGYQTVIAPPCDSCDATCNVQRRAQFDTVRIEVKMVF